jgi:tRNA A37 N6-isopentenylltransferase MiaA
VSRRRLATLIAAGAIVFVAISFLLARYLSTENRERDAVYALQRDQARGDAQAMLERLDGCDARCRANVEANARRLKRAGEVKILAYSSSTSYALGHAEGPTRVAWTIVNKQLPVVQCVQVERTGNVLAGATINLRRLSVPIDRQGTC